MLNRKTSPPSKGDVKNGSRSLTTVNTGWVFAFLSLVLVLTMVVFTSFNRGFPRVELFNAGLTIFSAIMLQALPFLTLGVIISAIISTLIPPTFWKKVLPESPSKAVPVAGCAGVLLPGCECASVPIASGLVSKGVAPAAALTFLLSAPAVNPIVVISTLVAFPDSPQIAFARFAASLITAIIVGFVWVRIGKNQWLTSMVEKRHDVLMDKDKMTAFRDVAVHDFTHAGGYLVIGAVIAALLNVGIPESWIEYIAQNPTLSVLGMAILAVMLSVCSEADAFIAASFPQFPTVALLVFMVVGPVVDMKIVAMQGGIFGKKFTSVFAPLTFFTAITVAVIVGLVIL